jgi:hypothetical protein
MAALASDANFPNEQIRIKIFDKVVSEIERIDGEGLPPRLNRPENWKTTIRKLRFLVQQSKTPKEFGQVFRKLDATYPNLHAQVVLEENYDIAANRLRPNISVKFGPEIVNYKQKNYVYKINSIDGQMLKDVRETTRPAIGDEVLAINGIPMSQWSKENFIFCKFPLREQCEMNIFDHFRKGFLSWDWHANLEYRLKRNERIWTTKIPVIIPQNNNSNNSGQASGQGECPIESGQYPDFKDVYKGYNICVFESIKYPGVSVLKIASFRYREIPKDSKIKSIDDEVNMFYEKYWKEKAPITKKMIIDVIDNGGGDVPIAWYKMFYPKPFQEQYVQFKKLPELEDSRLRKDLFYESDAKEIWFSELKKNQQYKKLKYGQFTPSVPQFCVDEKSNCNQGYFQPKDHGFKGEIRILVNEWCISTCTGFVWSFKDQLGKRVKTVGLPDSGDSAYARLYLDVYLDNQNPEGFRVEIAPRPGRTRQMLPENAIMRQQITATRSTTSKGKVISAIPTKIDIWIPYRYRDFDEPWTTKVFNAALNN